MKNNSLCDLPPSTRNQHLYYGGLPCERTHHGKGLQDVTSHSSLVSFSPSFCSTHATQVLHVFTLPCLQLGTDSSDQHLSDLIIIEISSNNYQYKEISSRGAVQKRDPAIQPRFRSPSTPPVVPVRQQHRDPDLAGTSQL